MGIILSFIAGFVTAVIFMLILLKIVMALIENENETNANEQMRM